MGFRFLCVREMQSVLHRAAFASPSVTIGKSSSQVTNDVKQESISDKVRVLGNNKSKVTVNAL